MTDLELARGIAAKFHAEKMYGPYPYTHHLNAVEASVTKAYSDDRLPIIAQLHDILEDTSCTYLTLGALFDNDIVSAVVAITKKTGEDRGTYLARVKLDQLALKVKIHDTLCNLTESVIRGDMKRIERYGHQIAFLAAS